MNRTPVPWDELVTTALLGTDRRPLPPGGEPADGPWADGLRADGIGAGGLAAGGLPTDRPSSPTRVLDLAAEHRARRQTGTPPEPVAALPAGPAEHRPPPPTAAAALLGALLRRPDAELLVLWLAACAAHGRSAPAESWLRLAQLTARRPGEDRALLAEVLGARGRWFLGQHPQAGRLLPVAAPVPVGVRDGDPSAVLLAGGQDRPAAELLEAVLACPDPWPDELSALALRLLGSGGLGPGTPAAGARLGRRLPLHLAPYLADWVSATADAVRTLPVALARTVRSAAAQVERTVVLRAEIEQVFTEPPTAEEPPA